MPIPIKYYSDENVSKAVIKGLKARGVDILTCQEAGMLKASDAEHLEFASRNGRVVFTHDTDFLRLHAQGINHAGIVYAANQRNIGGNIKHLKLIHDLLNAEELANKVEFI